jgi:hypothetical protein
MPLRRGAQSIIRRLSVVPAALLSAMMGAGAASVEIKDGNVFFVQDGQQRQLTKSGKAADPVLSPDGKWVAFTRVGNPEFDEPQDCESGEKADELRRIRVDGSGEELLYRGHEYPHHVKDPKYAYYAICWFSHKQFSSDGRYIFFLAPKWATSAALHRFDTRTRTSAFVTDANDVIVISDCRSPRTATASWCSNTATSWREEAMTFTGCSTAPARRRKTRSAGVNPIKRRSKGRSTGSVISYAVSDAVRLCR